MKKYRIIKSDVIDGYLFILQTRTQNNKAWYSIDSYYDFESAMIIKQLYEVMECQVTPIKNS